MSENQFLPLKVENAETTVKILLSCVDTKKKLVQIIYYFCTRICVVFSISDDSFCKIGIKNGS